MSDFNAKMHQIRFRLGLCSRPRWRELAALPKPLARFKGPLRGKGEGEGARKGRGKGWDGTGEGKGGRGGKGRRRAVAPGAATALHQHYEGCSRRRVAAGRTPQISKHGYANGQHQLSSS